MKCKVLKNIRNRDMHNNEISHKPGDFLEVNEDEVKYLLENKAIELIDEVFFASSINEEPPQYNTKEELNKLKKEELIIYANQLGLEIPESLKKDEVLNEILNFIEENQDND